MIKLTDSLILEVYRATGNRAGRIEGRAYRDEDSRLARLCVASGTTAALPSLCVVLGRIEGAHAYVDDPLRGPAALPPLSVPRAGTNPGTRETLAFACIPTDPAQLRC